MLRNLKLQSRFTIFILLVTLPLLVGSLLFLNNQASKQINEQANRVLRDANRAIEVNTSTWLEQQFRALQQTANLTDVISMDPTLQKNALVAMAQAHPNLYLVHTLDMNGFNVARNDDAELKDYSDREYFLGAISGDPIAYQVVIGRTSGQPSLVLAVPIHDKDSNIIGVASSAGQLDDVSQKVISTDLGKTGIAFIVDTDNKIIAHPDSTYTTGELQDFSEYPPVAALRQGQTGIINFVDKDGVKWRAFVSQIDNGWGIVAQQTEAELLTPIRTFHTSTLISAIVVLGFLIIFSSFVIRRNTAPIRVVTETAISIAEGNFGQRIPVQRNDEIGQLGNAFNAMAAKIQDLVSNLEVSVVERTTELEMANQQIQHRASQFEAIAQVARNISTSQNLETLLPKITNVVSERFGFYHVGIFLLDDEREFAVLRAANSPGGKKMLGRVHKLKVGETGIVGFVTSQGRPRIALDTGSDAVYFNNPDLPDTRSEMALPLIAGSQVIGALDVQSRDVNAFSQEDINTLSTLADQVSIAIQNARLYEETRNALAQSQALYKQFAQTGWSQFTQSQKLTGIQHNKTSTTILREPLATDSFDGGSTLDLPINLRNQKIGSLKIRASDDRQWTQDEIDIASAIIERAAIAMENARLLDDAQRRATREQIIGEISATVSSSTDMAEILRSAVQELGRKMGGAEVVLELGSENSNYEE